MNKHQILYDFKLKLEYEIKKNILFSLSIEEAQMLLFEKAGVLYKFTILSPNKSQELLKKYYITNQRQIDEISFFQESVKWIMRWCTQYCTKSPQEQSIKIQAEDIFKLMGDAYAYDRFHLFWDLHNQGVTRYSKDKKSITFNYVNEDVYKQHVCYDSLLRQLNADEGLNSIDSYDSSNFNELMKQAHTLDFKTKFNVEFLGFNLEEYKEFSTSLTELFSEYFLSKSKNNTYILHTKKEIGLIHTKEDWVTKIAEISKLKTKKIIDIINFFTYDYDSLKSDISLTYFIQLKDDLLLVPEVVFNLTRPEANALRLLAKGQSKNFDKAQNNYEFEIISKLTDSVFSGYLVSEKSDKSKKIRPGMDILIYDEKNNALQVIELKYKIPVESSRDILNLDNMLEEGYNQLSEAKKYVQTNLDTILEEYYGEKYKDVKPETIDHFILTNFSIGTGINKDLPTPILNLEHYIELMKDHNGIVEVRDSLYSKNKKIVPRIKKKHTYFKFLNNKIIYPEFMFILESKSLKSHLDTSR